MSMEALLATFELKKEQVTPSEKLLLLSLARRAGEYHECWPSLRRLIEDTGYSRKHIISLRQDLINKGLIKYTGDMKGKSKQVPIMMLTYVHKWQQNKKVTSHLDDTSNLVTSHLHDTGTGNLHDTGTSHLQGTLNIKEEKKSGKEQRERQTEIQEDPLPEQASPKSLSHTFIFSDKAKSLCQDKNLDIHLELVKCRNYYEGEVVNQGRFENWLIMARPEHRGDYSPPSASPPTEIRSTVPWWGPGHPGWESMHGNR